MKQHFAPTSAGFIFQTGADSADQSSFGQLTTIDTPLRMPITETVIGRQGIYFLSAERDEGGAGFGDSYIHVLPTPGGSTDLRYEEASKQTYIWKSKKFVMPGRTTWAAAKVVHTKGCVRLLIWIDCCKVYEAPVKGCGPFRLPDQLAGITLEFALVGTARVTEAHIASTMEELTNG